MKAIQITIDEQLLADSTRTRRSAETADPQFYGLKRESVDKGVIVRSNSRSRMHGRAPLRLSLVRNRPHFPTVL